MMGCKAFTVVASLALAGCLVAIPLLGCQDASNATPSSSSPSQGKAVAQSAPSTGDAAPAQESAPTLQATTSAVTVPVDFFDILGISERGREKFLERLGATDIAAQDDGSYVVSLSSEDFAAFASHAYQAIQDKIKSSTIDGTYTGDLVVNGEVCKFKTIQQSEQAGIAIIHQELALVPESF